MNSLEATVLEQKKSKKRKITNNYPLTHNCQKRYKTKHEIENKFQINFLIVIQLQEMN